MTDDLIARLRGGEWLYKDVLDAADALEAKDARIAELEAERDEWKSEVAQIADVWEAMWRGKHKEARAEWLIKDIVSYANENTARIAALEAALKPFADLLATAEKIRPSHDRHLLWVETIDLRAAAKAYKETGDE